MCELEKKVDINHKSQPEQYNTAHIFDAMALAHMTNLFGASIFGEIALKYYQLSLFG